MIAECRTFADRRGEPPSVWCAMAGPVLGALLLCLALAGCAGPDAGPPRMAVDDACATAADCEDSAALSEQVQRDTDAMLAGMAHARAHLGLQEDAAP